MKRLPPPPRGLAFELPLTTGNEMPNTMPFRIATALLIALVVGLAAGVLPAIRAARLDPIEALRAE